MRMLKWFLLVFLLLVLLAGTGSYTYLNFSQPKYNGQIDLAGPESEIEILFDRYAIPHIYGQSERDAYFALGYVHGQERLFQMELLRRLTTGRLAEILGPDLLKVDVLFRTLGIHEVSKQSDEAYMSERDQPYQIAVEAYLEGLNSFIREGYSPPEFTLLGIPKTEYTSEDIYHILGYMAFSFANAYKEDPLIDKIMQNYGPDYLNDLVVNHATGMQTIPVWMGDTLEADAYSGIKPINYPSRPAIFKSTKPSMAAQFDALQDLFPVPLLQGSNAWVIGPNKTLSGHVLFENDPHIGFSQPAVWYEAHVEAPNFSFYGHHIAGIPFGLIGHTREHAWGFTMLESDDMDFFRERINPDNPLQVWEDDHWQDLETREEIIRIKGGKDTSLQVLISRHGPLVQGVFDLLDPEEAIAMSWTYLKSPSKALQATYGLSHAREMMQFEEHLAMIEAPGLNTMYGDKEGNIAWWAVGRFTRYPDHVNTKLILDGASGEDEPEGYYPFKENPRSINPPDNFVYSANNQPDTTLGRLYPGYYLPEGRGRRIYEWLSRQDLWTVEQMKEMAVDTRSLTQPPMVKWLLAAVSGDHTGLSEQKKKALKILADWDGNHLRTALGPTIFHRWSFYLQKLAYEDEIGANEFQSSVSGFFFRRSLHKIIPNDSSLWWDNVKTASVKESRRDILLASLDLAIEQLNEQLGPDIQGWQWGKVHTLTHGHALGKVEPLDKLFNVGNFVVDGGNDVINCIGSRIDSTGYYHASYGPSKRTVIDFQNIEKAFCVLPTGQSGNFMSDHYADQADLYNAGEYRFMLMNRDDIEQEEGGTLLIRPAE